jgi:DNA-binding MarR family transcriptional regulator
LAEFSNSPLIDTESIEKDKLIQEMMVQVANLQRRIQSEGEDEERTWMMANTDDPQVRSFLKEASVVMLHVVDAIGDLGPVNGITISKKYDIPRGSVSKITRRLAALRMVQAEYLKGNKKEVLFHLTSLGHSVYTLHKLLHRRIERNVRQFLSRYDVEQMKFMVQCLRDTSETSWVAGQTSEEKTEITQEPPGGSPLSYPPQQMAEISEILTMLKQLDEHKLQKAKDLLRIAFF